MSTNNDELKNAERKIILGFIEKFENGDTNILHLMEGVGVPSNISDTGIRAQAFYMQCCLELCVKLGVKFGGEFSGNAKEISVKIGDKSLEEVLKNSNIDLDLNTLFR